MKINILKGRKCSFGLNQNTFCFYYFFDFSKKLFLLFFATLRLYVKK